MKNLRQYRQAAGLTMKQLGELVGVSEATICNYERGAREANYETQLKLGEVLGCSVDDLLRGEAEPLKTVKPNISAVYIPAGKPDAVKQMLFYLIENLSYTEQADLLIELLQKEKSTD